MISAHYVSLEIAKELAEAGVLFPESDRVWIRLIKKPFTIPLGFEKWEIGERVYIKEYCAFKKLKKYGYQEFSYYEYGASQACFKYLPAPSLSEILDVLGREHSTGFLGNKAVCFDNTEITWRGEEIALADTRPDAAGLMAIKLEREKK